MSKLFKWFKKDKPTKQTPQDEIASQQAQILDPEEVASAQSSDELVEISNQESVKQASHDTSDKPPTVSDAVRHYENDDKNEEVDARIDELVPDTEQHAPFLAQDKPQGEAITDVIEPIPLDVEPIEAKIESEAIVTPVQAEKTSLFARLKASLSRTKANIGSGFSSLLTGKVINDELYEELETQLLLADVGINTTSKIIDELTKSAKRSQLKDGAALSIMLQKQMQAILDQVNVPLDFKIATDEQGKKHPFVILMVGVNGVGKTTTIGKLAKQFQAQGKSVMLAAGDTFRAAAVEQLQVWGERNHIPVVAQHTGADSASVIFDAIESAKAKRIDVLIADTAGRLQNKDHLIEELKKVVRVMKKLNPQAPHEIMLTLDASTGQNAVSQTRIFNQAVGITGINLTKLDGSAKGGVIFALANEFKIPVRYIGIGEGIDDLREFDAKAFVEALFSQ